MKKIVALALCLVIAFSMVGCGSKTVAGGAPVAGGSYMPDKNDTVEISTDKTVDPTIPVPNEYEGNKLNNPETYDDMMSGWFAVVEVDRKDIENCADFDAQLSHASAGVGVSDTNNIRKDVCELYLAVLEDLWNVDPGLNSGISQIGIDLSELSHLIEDEKDTVMKEFAAKHNLPYIAGTWEELCERGYINKDNLYWEDGLFFSIKTKEDAVWNLPAIKNGDHVPELTSFDAQKWRSGLGAYFFGQCTAQKNADGTWSYTVGQEAIS